MRIRTIGIVVLIVLGLAVAGGIGTSLFQAGYAQGVAADGAELVVGRGYYYPGLYGFGVIGIMLKALFALLLFGLFARLFFFRGFMRHGRGPWMHGEHGPHGDRREEFRSRMEDHLAEWHDRAHAEPDVEPASE